MSNMTPNDINAYLQHADGAETTLCVTTPDPNDGSIVIHLSDDTWVRIVKMAQYVNVDALDNRDLNETDLLVKMSVDPVALFANACANDSETLCEMIALALDVALKGDVVADDAHAMTMIAKALRAE